MGCRKITHSIVLRGISCQLFTVSDSCDGDRQVIAQSSECNSGARQLHKLWSCNGVTA